MLKRPQIIVQVILHQGDEIIHEFRGNGFLRLFVFVYRLIDSLPHDPLPHPIHDNRGKVIIGRHHPIGEVITSALVIPALGRTDSLSKMRLSPDHLPGISITILVITGKLDTSLPSTSKGEVIDVVPDPFHEPSKL